MLAPEAAVAYRHRLREAGGRVVLTNGCFDLLHVGHVRYLESARALGDALLVGVNSDRSIRGLKTGGRPFVTENERAEVIAALAAVDAVVVFDELTASRLVDLLEPDLYCKGGDYTLESLPEAPHVLAYGGEIRFLPFESGHSTTRLVDRILAAHGRDPR
ncbi:MAG: D-glycero-beta-D-manno-heptose 1-phosphate adenylyltransferase [Chloroflexi bacterium]|nr:D-glycero-beta-D-manno-heptose 1-phosphate adenylyltransferase [Chloroflexota bacterium]